MSWISSISLLMAAGMYGVIALYWSGKFKSNNGYSFWGRESWTRKYKMRSDTTLILAPDSWYYRFFKLKYKERFPLSATTLVAFTDGFHLTQWFMIRFITLAITQNLLTYLIYSGIWFVGFDIIYNKRIPDIIKRIRGGS